MSNGTKIFKLKDFEEEEMLQELVQNMDPKESTFFFLIQSPKRMKFFEFLRKHFKIQANGHNNDYFVAAEHIKEEGVFRDVTQELEQGDNQLTH